MLKRSAHSNFIDTRIKCANGHDIHSLDHPLILPGLCASDVNKSTLKYYFYQMVKSA